MLIRKCERPAWLKLEVTRVQNRPASNKGRVVRTCMLCRIVYCSCVCVCVCVCVCLCVRARLCVLEELRPSLLWQCMLPTPKLSTPKLPTPKLQQSVKPCTKLSKEMTKFLVKFAKEERSKQEQRHEGRKRKMALVRRAVSRLRQT